MAEFNEVIPRWDATGTEPPESLQIKGWEANQKPPADYFNWFFSRTSAVLRELQEKAADDSALTEHLEDKDNPHEVTAEQLNVYTKEEVDTKLEESESETAGSLTEARKIELINGATGSTMFDGSKDVKIDVELAGNAPSASKLETARQLSLSGDVEGTGTFDGSSNLNIEATMKQASLTEAGKVQLENALDSNSDTKAATASAVKKVSDLANTTGQNVEEHIDNKENPHEVTASQVGAYTKEEIDGQIGNLDDLETESKENLVSAINELKNDTAEIADTSVKTISVGKGLERVVHYPDENGDINFSDDFYVPNQGKVIAEGDMVAVNNKRITLEKVDCIELSPLQFVINISDFLNAKGIAIEYDLRWSSFNDDGEINYWDKGTEKNIPVITKLSQIPESISDKVVYFRATESSASGPILFDKNDIEFGKDNFTARTIYGSVVRRYVEGVSIDAKLTELFEGGKNNFTKNMVEADKYLDDYGNKTFDRTPATLKGAAFYKSSINEPKKEMLCISKGNSITCLLNIIDDNLTITPIPCAYIDDLSNPIKGYYVLMLYMVPTKIYYYY